MQTTFDAGKPFPKRQILYFSYLKEFADGKINSDENGRKFYKRIENTVGEMRIRSLRAMSPFPTVFSNDLHCSYVKTRVCLAKGYLLILTQFFWAGPYRWDFEDDRLNAAKTIQVVS